MSVRADTLLLGALYALEQCGLLLEDAVTLFEHSRYATAIGVAMMAREELGKNRLLIGYWKDASTPQGFALNFKQVNEVSRGHIDKQERAQMGIVIRGEIGTSEGELMQAESDNPVGSDAWRDARQQLEEKKESIREEQPKKRYRRRMEMLYVDMTSDTSWSRPSEIQKTDRQALLNEVLDAVNDYAPVYGQFEGGTDEALTTALAALGPDKPSLPSARRLTGRLIDLEKGGA